MRLLTLDQLSRAAGVVCALELMRGEPAWQDGDKKLLGDWPIEIGLWVGAAATPNRLGKTGRRSRPTPRSRGCGAFAETAAKRRRRSRPARGAATPFSRDSFACTPTRRRAEEHADPLRRARPARSPATRSLPILTVDEAIYRRLPAFVIATVDKFAGLPWLAEAGAFFGNVDREDQWGFYGAADAARRWGDGCSAGASLLPPALIVQDELHLISGPLGTVAALYEAVLDRLATRTGRARRIRPKIVASTATVRRAAAQIEALFDRQADRGVPAART